MAHHPLPLTAEELARKVTGHPGLLRLQAGFNPNSSSVGSVVQFMLWSAVAATAIYQTTVLLFPQPAADPKPTEPPSDAPA